MDPEEAFERLGVIVALYLDLRLEAISAGVQDPLNKLPQLSESRNPRLSSIASELLDALAWVWPWFPTLQSPQLVLIADLVTRALNRQTNRDPEDQLVRLVATELGTVRARGIIDQLEAHGPRGAKMHRPKPPSRRAAGNQGHKLLKRVANKP